MKGAMLLEGGIKWFIEWVFHWPSFPHSQNGPKIKKMWASSVIFDNCSRGVVIIRAKKHGFRVHFAKSCHVFKFCILLLVKKEDVHKPLHVLYRGLLLILLGPTTKKKVDSLPTLSWRSCWCYNQPWQTPNSPKLSCHPNLQIVSWGPAYEAPSLLGFSVSSTHTTPWCGLPN